MVDILTHPLNSDLEERQRWAENAEATDARAALHGSDARRPHDRMEFADTIPLDGAQCVDDHLQTIREIGLVRFVSRVRAGLIDATSGRIAIDRFAREQEQRNALPRFTTLYRRHPRAFARVVAVLTLAVLFGLHWSTP